MSYFIYQQGAKRKINSRNISTVRQQKFSTLIIKFRGGISRSTADFNKANGLIQKKTYNKAKHIYICHFKKTTMRKLAELAKRYYESGVADFAEPHVLHHIKNTGIVLNDPQFAAQWIFENTGQNNGLAGDDIGILEGLQLIADSQIILDPTICIAVLDEGVDTRHPDLQNPTLWQNNFSVFGQGKLLPKSQDHHGTSVAGVIAAIQNNGIGVAGINPFCKMMSGRIYFTQDNVHGADPLDISDGIQTAIDNNVRVINLSWKIEPNMLVAEAIKDGFSKGVVFCVAAGNYVSQQDEHTVRFPGVMDEVITVAACNNRSEWVNLSNSPDDQKFGSCHGREVDIAAPGLFISTTKNNGKYTNIFCGTSAATAIVSAVAAILLAINPNLSNTEVRDILLSTADHINGMSEVEHLNKVGHGKINAFKAIERAIATLPV